MNVPLRAGTDDEVYLSAFEAIVPPLVEQFAADMVFAEIGADTHKDDRLAHLNLTSNGYKQVVSRIKDISPKIMAMGGGGYNVYKTAALWTLAWSALSGTTPEDKFTGLVGGMMYGPEADAGSLEDLPFVLEGREKELCVEQANRVVDTSKRRSSRSTDCREVAPGEERARFNCQRAKRKPAVAIIGARVAPSSRHSLPEPPPQSRFARVAAGSRRPLPRHKPA